MKAQLKIALLLLLPAVSLAQVPVDEDGNVIGEYQTGVDAPLLSGAELEDLVGPIALYPDDLLAIVLPASAYPLQIVEAARFLKAYENDSSLEPDSNWDDSVVALTNYPEVVELLNDDLDWTLRLGEAVVAQQTDVVSAVEAFRDRAYAAGNLKSDEYQTVSEDDGVIYISPAEEDVIYVPYYEPESVVYYQPRSVYYYHPRAYPVYYYPYAAGHHFNRGFFWGVTTAFTIGWDSHSLHTYHHSYNGHPYYGRSYWNHWYRRPSIHVYNSYYTHNYRNSGRHNYNGDRWRAREQRREYVRREGYSRSDRQRDGQPATRRRQTETIAFRERDARGATTRQIARSRSDARDRNNVRNRGKAQNRSDTAERRTTTARSNSRSREEAVVARNRETTQRQSNSRTREGRRQESVDRRESQRSSTRRQQPQAQTTDRTRPQTRRQQPAVVPRATPRQEPARQRRESAPAPQRRQSESRQQPARQQAARQQESRSNKSEARGNESRSRSRDRKR